jgi:indole-3-glycerol phosphate synthase
MNILDEIAAYKAKEVGIAKSLHPVSVLEKSPFFQRRTISMKQSLLHEDSSGIIAEFKRKSPSLGTINNYSDPEKVCADYMLAGASAISVLTDEKYFGGSSSDLMNVRGHVDRPVLRKDFIIDEYQIIEARSIGADAVLLIAELHRIERLDELHRFALSLELEVLVEVHEEINILRIPPDAQMIGINRRNLASFSLDPDHTSRLIRLLPDNALKVAESGIKSVTDYFFLRDEGFNAFLIGEYFMKTPDPGRACEIFITEIRKQTNIEK